MNTPYEILGISENADVQTVKNAYRELAGKYSEENYAGGPFEDLAKEKMRLINKAYDDIVQSRADEFKSDSGFTERRYSEYSTWKNHGNAHSGLGDIRAKILSGRIDDAQTLLDGMPPNQRNAEWFFLKGSIHHRRGWLEEAYENYARACEMDPTNLEYRGAFDNLSISRNKGRKKSTDEGTTGATDCFHCYDGCDLCDICGTLLCLDCCCETMGCDLCDCC
ncbi:MAG TPA: J domain-containing protein [Clostridiales bacterium]|nr:J domain-containing protein [Clostridiales bacterium]HRT81526.1 J domain-containing protein [Oscillospiraceae bacterium]